MELSDWHWDIRKIAKKQWSKPEGEIGRYLNKTKHNKTQKDA